MEEKNPRVSVIVRTKNCENIIGESLAALFSQHYKDFELIVVDSGSTDSTLEIVGEYPCTLIHMPPDEYISGKALNLGASHARGKLLIFQNSDTVPLTPDALGLLVAALDDPEVQAAYARQVARPDAWSWVRLELESAFPAGDVTPPWITFEAPFSIMRKTAWEEHPFFEDAMYSEDTEWGHWARRNGMRIEYVKDARAMHSHNHNLRQVYSRLFCEGEALALFLGDKNNILAECGRAFTAILKEWAYAMRQREFADIPYIPIRRAVMHCAYYKGHKLGEWRLATANRDPSMGQRIILNNIHPDLPRCDKLITAQEKQIERMKARNRR